MRFHAINAAAESRFLERPKEKARRKRALSKFFTGRRGGCDAPSPSREPIPDGAQ
jgi:hypothetical protein